MQTKHTAGEWKAGTNTASKEWMQIFSGKKIVAEVNTIHRQGQREAGDFEQEMANVRLIAAAPELLKALQDVLGMCDYPYKEMATYKQANAVIQKATGNQDQTQ